ncbi:Trm112 family protein [Aquabacterium lacunae]|uniref:UPF0434 protein EYS42_04125 n=1 Tax=Aquabacterium lacunae TaxID=2528630 RepID=A0A4Q9H567_9BURK|nr:Trm112 family protein [Aquabacterium lacunae]TBO32397.1 Trm112 family protein [Aquabacterium lacunae]
MDTRLIELLVCPVCKGPLQRSDDRNSLICHADRLAFPIRDGIPVMLESEAVSLDAPAPAQASLPADLPSAD